MHIDKLDDIVNKYNNTYHSTIKMKPLDFILFRIDFFGAAHGWGEAKNVPLPKICHTYPSMMKLGTVVSYLRNIQKII